MQVDTNVLVRHVTGSPAAQARRATAFLRQAERLDLPDLIVAELVSVLESVYRQPRPAVAAVVRAVVAFPAIRVGDERLVLRAIELYETQRVDFAEAYLAAAAERTDGQVVSFDRGLDRIGSVRRIEP
ncbi:MAG TPA: PIN domain-containing protein [Egibacteraceae bacterium]|nr:PIN domain-containing protein [Egibacteraceae bacterium]